MQNPVIPCVEITQEVLDALGEHKQIEGSEKAGVLVGVALGHNRYRIKKVSPSMTIDGATRTGCKRDAKLANLFVQEQYEQSGHTCVYMGEWHTHPEFNPIPSSVDISSVINIYHLPNNNLPFIILCIIGLENIYWGYVINDRLKSLDVTII